MIARVSGASFYYDNLVNIGHNSMIARDYPLLLSKVFALWTPYLPREFLIFSVFLRQLTAANGSLSAHLNAHLNGW